MSYVGGFGHVRGSEMSAGARRLRRFLDDLHAQGTLLEVEQAVDPAREMAAHVEAAKGWPILFHRVGAARFPILFNVFGHPGWVANRLGTSPEGIADALLDACTRPIEPIRVPSQHSISVSSPLDLRDWIPIGRDMARQRAACINAGVVLVRDPDTGLENTSMHTLNVIAPNRLVIHVQSNHFARIYGKWQKRREPMPMAVALGLDPAVWLTCGLTIAHPPSELAVAGAFGGAVPLMACGTVDLEVPAMSEIVLEGHVPPGERGPGGPEPLPSHEYGLPYRGPVMEVHRLTAFGDAVPQGLVNGSTDHQNQLAWLKEFSVVKHLREHGFAEMVRAVKVNPTGNDWHACVVTIERPFVAEASRIVESLLTGDIAIHGLRRVTAVDTDIDIADPAAIEWAVATRLRPERDLIVISSGRGGPDPVGRDGTAKVGVVAIISPGHEAEHVRAVVDWEEPVPLQSHGVPVPPRAPQPVRR